MRPYVMFIWVLVILGHYDPATGLLLTFLHVLCTD